MGSGAQFDCRHSRAVCARARAIPPLPVQSTMDRKSTYSCKFYYQTIIILGAPKLDLLGPRMESGARAHKITRALSGSAPRPPRSPATSSTKAMKREKADLSL